MSLFGEEGAAGTTLFPGWEEQGSLSCASDGWRLPKGLHAWSFFRTREVCVPQSRGRLLPSLAGFTAAERFREVGILIALEPAPSSDSESGF